MYGKTDLQAKQSLGHIVLTIAAAVFSFFSDRGKWIHKSTKYEKPTATVVFTVAVWSRKKILSTIDAPPRGPRGVKK